MYLSMGLFEFFLMDRAVSHEGLPLYFMLDWAALCPHAPFLARNVLCFFFSSFSIAFSLQYVVERTRKCLGAK